MLRRTAGRALRAKGFTLVELMITVVIVAILASIAIPAYTAQIRKSRRTEARTALLDLAGREERYLATNNHYSNTAADLGYTAFGAGTPVGSGYYYLNVAVVAGDSTTAPTFTATASPVAGKGQDVDSDCQAFTLTSTGAQGSTNSGGTDSSSICWQ
jgi:type IV pilus assembly protein PilE